MQRVEERISDDACHFLEGGDSFEEMIEAKKLSLKRATKVWPSSPISHPSSATRSFSEAYVLTALVPLYYFSMWKDLCPATTS